MREGEKHILVVDDNKVNLTLVKQALSEYQVTPVISGMQALKFLERKTPDLILLDVNMPEMDGKTTLKRIRSQERLKNIPVIFLTADNSSETEVKCLELGAEDYIAKPFVAEVMKQRISRILELWELRDDLEKQLVLRTRQMETVTIQSVTAIAYAIDAKDPYTHGHSVRVAKCSVEIAKHLKWSREDQQNLYFSALLHDIGKIGIPDSILNKSSSLTEEEFGIMKQHPAVGGKILRDIHSIRHMEDGARYHHEKYDGTGYPYGLKGDQIPFMARIIGVADAYDAMSSDRAYRKHLTQDKVQTEIRRGRGTQFDPLLADVFLDMMDQGFALTEREEIFPGEKAAQSGELSQMLLQKTKEQARQELKNTFFADPLTGLYNRGYAKGRICRYLEEGKDSAACTLYIIGVKGLKDVADKFGNIYKDAALTQVAALLKEEKEENSFTARINGSEFLYFVEGETKRDVKEWAQAFLKKAREQMQKTAFGQWISLSIGITVSEGGIVFRELSGYGDKALYHAMQSGQWNLHCYTPDKRKDMGREADIRLLRDLIGRGNRRFLEDTFGKRAQEIGDVCIFLRRCMEQKEQRIQLILLTLSDRQMAQEMDPMIMEEAMERLGSAVGASIRSMDVSVRFGSSQMLVALIDGDVDGRRQIAEQIVARFKENYPTKRIDVTCHTEEMALEKGEPAFKEGGERRDI